MLRYKNNLYIYDDYKLLGRYMYYFIQQYVKYEPAQGISIKDAFRAAKNLALKFKAEVKMNINNIDIVVPNSTRTRQKDIIDKYHKLLHDYEQLRQEQSQQKN